MLSLRIVGGVQLLVLLQGLLVSLSMLADHLLVLLLQLLHLLLVLLVSYGGHTSWGLLLLGSALPMLLLLLLLCLLTSLNAHQRGALAVLVALNQRVA